jgi:cytoskeletal protein CcmA (bactofilin family)
LARHDAPSYHAANVLSNILKKNDTTVQPAAHNPVRSSLLDEPLTAAAIGPMREFKTSTTSKSTTVLTAETEFRGTLGFSGDLELHGRLEGSIESDNGLLTIGETALVKAGIKAQDLMVYGKVQGDIMATGRIELRGKAQVYGDIRAGRLLIEEGVTFVGRSESLHAKTEEKPDFNHIFNKLSTNGAPVEPIKPTSR